MPSDPRFKIVGLYTNGNVNSTVPPGALTQADNCVVRANGQLEPRRGWEADGALLNGTPRAFTFFGNGRIAQILDDVPFGALAGNQLWYSPTMNTPWVAYSGTYDPVDAATIRMKFVEAQQNLYFNTSTGLKVLSSLTGTPTAAGVVSPNDLRWVSAESGLTANPNASGTWFAKNTAVSYRALLGTRDSNNNLKLSAPTGRYVVINPNDASVAVGGLVRTALTTVTVTTSAAHSFKVGDIVIFTEAAEAGPPAFGAGPFTIATVPSTTTFTYAEAGTNGPSVATKTFTSGSKNVSFNIDFKASTSTTSHFVRVYRSLASVLASADPGDELFQIYERRLTTAEVAAGTLVFTDITPESSLYSTPLYTNPKTGDSIVASNDVAPISKDVALWQERLWFANTTGKHRYTLQILGTGTPDGIQDGDLLVIGGIPFYWSNRFGGTTSGIYSNVKYTTLLTPGNNIAWSAQQLVDKINSLWRAGTVSFRASYISALSDAPGRILIETDTPSTTAFYIAASRVNSFSPTPATNKIVLNTSARVGTTVTVNTSTAHGFVTGDQVYIGSLTAISAFPVGVKTLISGSGTVFTYTETGSATSFDTTYVVHKLDQKSNNDTRPNGIMFSKYQEHEAVPTANYLTVGSKSKNILRIVPMRDKLYVFKEDGVYTVSGAPPYSRVDLLDPTCILISADSPAVLGGKIYALTRQGVVTVSDSGVGVVSYPIEFDLLQLTEATTPTTGFGTAYETDRCYFLCLTRASPYAYVYNYMSQAWTRWVFDQSRVDGIVHMGVDPITDKLSFFGCRPTAYDCIVYQELKTGTSYADYYDGSGSIVITAINTATGIATVGLGSTVHAAGNVVIASNGTPMVFLAAGSGAIDLAFVYDTTYAAPATGTATEYFGISTTVKFAKNTGGQPAMAKHWREVTLHFDDSNAYTVTASVGNGQGSNDSSVATPAPGSWLYTTLTARNVRCLVPLEYQRGAFLQAGFNITQSRCLWRLNGITYEVAPTSLKVQR